MQNFESHGPDENAESIESLGPNEPIDSIKPVETAEPTKYTAPTETNLSDKISDLNGIGESNRSSFDPKKIYNKTYEYWHDVEEDKAHRLKGEIFRNDIETIYLSPKNGIVRIQYISRDQLEEDLATIYGAEDQSKLILGQERHQQLFQEACKEVFDFCGDYLDRKFVNTVFPNVYQVNSTDYDFMSTKLKCFVLDNQTFHYLINNIQENPNFQKNSYVNGKYLTKSGSRIRNAKYNGLYLPVEEVNSNTSLIVMQEISGLSKEMSDEELRLPENVKQVEIDLRHIMRHEILHALRKNKSRFPNDIEEGIVNMFSQLSDATKEEVTTNSYPLETSLVYAVGQLCYESGMNIGIFKQAFLGNNPDSIKIVRETIKYKMGEEFTERFFDKGFPDDVSKIEALEKIKKTQRT